MKTTKNKTMKIKKYSTNTFKEKITYIFFENLLMIKMYHWNTYNFSIHKATDELYGKINENMDKFMEIFLGKLNGKRINHIKPISIIYVNSKDQMKKCIENFKSFLVGMDKSLKSDTNSEMTNSDLLNIRDEILGDLNQFLYLLTLD